MLVVVIVSVSALQTGYFTLQGLAKHRAIKQQPLSSTCWMVGDTHTHTRYCSVAITPTPTYISVMCIQTCCLSHSFSLSFTNGPPHTHTHSLKWRDKKKPPKKAIIHFIEALSSFLTLLLWNSESLFFFFSSGA